MLNEIRIEQRNDCSLVFGIPSPHQQLVLTSKYGETRRYDPDAARLAGANIAMGSLENLNKLHAVLVEENRARFFDRYRISGLSDAAIEWLLSGRQDLSSATIFAVTTGIIPDSLGSARPHHYPDRPAELAKCIALIDAVPEVKANFDTVAEISPAWAKIHAYWDELRQTCIAELNLERDLYAQAPQTERLIASLLADDEPSSLRLHAELFQ